jgi:hypothetical protein
MSCQRCNSKRILRINAKTADRCFAYYNGNERDGYAPEIPGLGGDDYIEFQVCLDCGQMRGTWPVDDAVVAKAFGGPAYCDECCEAFDWPSEVHRCGRCRKTLCKACGGGVDYCDECSEKLEAEERHVW